jgi:protein arginine kinase
MNDASLMIHTMLRLSRNLRGIPFPHRLNDVQKAQLTEELCGKISRVLPLSVLRLSTLNQAQLYSLAEHHIISPEHARSPHGKAVLKNEQNTFFININCDNHLELVAFGDSPDLMTTYRQLRETDELLERLFPYAFDDRLGFLVPSAENIGTALEASVMLHLPALKENRTLRRMEEYLTRLGFGIRGCYGKPAEAVGAFYRLSNRLTMGLPEEAVLKNLSAVAMQLARQEAHAENDLVGSELAEECMRRTGSTMMRLREISLDDAIVLLSDMRLCGSLEMCNPVPTGLLRQLLERIQPATLLNDNLQCMSMQELDARRAELIRTAIALSAI